MNVPDVEHQRPLPHSAADFKEGAAGASRAQGPRWTRPLVLAVWAATLAVAVHAWVAYTNGKGERALRESWRDALANLEMNEAAATLGLRLPLEAGLVSDPRQRAALAGFLEMREQGSRPSSFGRRQCIHLAESRGLLLRRWCRELGPVPF